MNGPGQDRDDRGGGDYRDSALRPYVITRGRARPSRNTIGVDSLLVAAEPAKALSVSATREQRALLRMCRQLLSLVEAAAHLGLPVSIVAIVASDLVDSGHLAARSTTPETVRSDRDLLQEVLDGLRRLR
jgi:hypothetical protein